ncbi:MAG TPA: hypothetical protein V6D33_17420, partial [Cyanophyceae cyanobacterium]
MAKLRDCLPTPFARTINRNDLRMELQEFLDIWDCSSEEIRNISGRFTLEELEEFWDTPEQEAYQFGLLHTLWSRQIGERIEQGDYQQEFQVPEPITPSHRLWSQLDELYSFNITPREFKAFWNVTDWQLARILKADINQVEKYLKVPAKTSVPPLVCFFLGFLHHQWMLKLGTSA